MPGFKPQILECQVRGLRRRSAPGNGSDPREKNIQFEWLGEIVVRAAVQPLHDVGPRIARRNDDDRRVQPRLAQFPQDAQAIHAGKHDVEKNHVDVGRQAELKSAVSVIGKQDGMPLGLERPAQQIGGIRSVFGYQDSYMLDLALRMLISDDRCCEISRCCGRFLRLSSDSLALMLL